MITYDILPLYFNYDYTAGCKRRWMEEFLPINLLHLFNSER